MYKKLLGMFLMGASFLLCSCIDDTYDVINKEISTDVEIKGNKLALPLGSLKAFELDSWFKDLEILETMDDGVYAFIQRDTIEPQKKQPEAILLDIKSQHIESKIDVPEYMPEIPSIPSMSRATTIPGLDLIANPITIPFEETNTFSFTNPISVQYMYIESVALQEELPICLKIKLDGLNVLQTSSVNLDFTLDLPAFFHELHNDDNLEGLSIEKNRLTIKREYPLHSEDGIIIKLRCHGLDFKNEETSNTGLHPELKEDGKTYLVYDGQIKAEGEVQINWTEDDILNIKDIEEIGLNLDCSFKPVHVQTLNGTFYEEFDRWDRTFVADLGEQLASLKGAENYITLSEPQVEVLLHNGISIPINVELDVIGKDKEGNPIASEEIHTVIPIKEAEYHDVTGLIVPDTSRLFFTNNTTKNHEDGFTNIEIENLSHLLEELPDSIQLSIHPIIDKSKPHHIDIYQALNIGASYKVVVPFKFDKLHITYSDTISMNLGDILGSLGDGGISLKMSIVNTIPLGLKLKFTALDENDNPIDKVTIESIEIEAGTGESILACGDEEKQEVTLAIKGDSEYTTQINKLKLSLEAQTEDATMGLKGIQGLHISDISVEISADISSEDFKTEDDENEDEDEEESDYEDEEEDEYENEFENEDEY